MNDEIVQLPPRTREAEILDVRSLEKRAEDGDAEVMRLEMSFSSEEPVDRFDWDRWETYSEILDHSSAKSARFDRINAGAPLLFNHDFDKHIGTVEKAWIDAKSKKAYAIVRFGDNDLALQKVKDIKSGILKKVSFMYAVHSLEQEGGVIKGEKPTYRSKDWEPYEVSFVTVPADYKVGLDDASRSGGPVACRVVAPIPNQAARSAATKGASTMPAEVTAVDPAEVKKMNERLSTLEAEHSKSEADKVRTLKILGKARAHDVLDLGAKAVEENWDVEKFNDALVEEVKKRGGAPVDTTIENHLDLSDKDKRQFSVIRLINSLRSGKRDEAGFEMECSDQIGKRWNKEPDLAKVTRGAFIPYDIQTRMLPADQRTQRRDLTAGSQTGGGYTIQNQYGSMIELLRHNTEVSKYVTYLPGLKGDFKISRQTGAGTAYWIGESSDPTESSQAFGLITMTPKKLGSMTDLTDELLSQSSIDVEQFVINDLAKVMGLKLDLGIINGVGAAGEPLGILNHSGIGSVTTSGGLTHTESVEFLTDVINSDYPVSGCRFITNGTIMGTAMTTLKDSVAGAGYIWEGGPESGRIAGMPASYSTNIPASTMIFGDFSQVIVGKWGDLQIGVDLAANFPSGGVRVRLLDKCDVALRHVGAFSVATDI